MNFSEFAEKHPKEFDAAIAEMNRHRLAELLDRSDTKSLGDHVWCQMDIAKDQHEQQLAKETPV